MMLASLVLAFPLLTLGNAHLSKHYLAEQWPVHFDAIRNAAKTINPLDLALLELDHFGPLKAIASAPTSIIPANITQCLQARNCDFFINDAQLDLYQEVFASAFLQKRLGMQSSECASSIR